MWLVFCFVVLYGMDFNVQYILLKMVFCNDIMLMLLRSFFFFSYDFYVNIEFEY